MRWFCISRDFLRHGSLSDEVENGFLLEMVEAGKDIERMSEEARRRIRNEGVMPRFEESFDFLCGFWDMELLLWCWNWRAS